MFNYRFSAPFVKKESFKKRKETFMPNVSYYLELRRKGFRAAIAFMIAKLGRKDSPLQRKDSEASWKPFQIA